MRAWLSWLAAMAALNLIVLIPVTIGMSLACVLLLGSLSIADVRWIALWTEVGCLMSGIVAYRELVRKAARYRSFSRLLQRR